MSGQQRHAVTAVAERGQAWPRRGVRFPTRDRLCSSSLRPSRCNAGRRRVDVRRFWSTVYAVGGVHVESRDYWGAHGHGGRATLSVAPQGFGGITLACAAAAVSAEVLDVAFTSVTLRLRSRARAKDVLRMAGPAVAASLPLYAPIVALLAFAYQEVSPWTLPLFFVPALAAQRLLRSTSISEDSLKISLGRMSDCNARTFRLPAPL